MYILVICALRTILAIIFLIITTRLFGKFASRNVTYLGFMVHITVGAISANLAFNLKLSASYFITSFLVFITIIFLLNVLIQHIRIVRKWLLGEPAVIIKNGKMLENNIKRAGFTLDFISQELRFRDIFNIDEVEHAIIEPNGHFSILKKPEYRPVIRKDLSIPLPSKQENFPVELIMDGKIIESNLEINKISEFWVLDELRKKNLELQDINYAVKGTNNQLYFDLYKDNI